MIEKKSSRIRYSDEFKAEAVAKCLEIGVKQTSKELGVSTQSLNLWVRMSKADGSRVSGKPSYEELEKENRKLKRELGYVGEINKILKKSTAIFSASELGDSQ